MPVSLESNKLVLGVNMAVVVLESVLYALLLVSASTTLYLRFSRHEVPKLLVWNPVVLFTILISATSGAHWILTTVRFFDAFLCSADVERFYLDNSQETQTARSLLSITSTFIGDAAIIHRLWLIWNRSLPVIILPVMSCLGLLINGCARTYLITQPPDRHLPMSIGWAKAGWTINLVNNAYCTGFIVWKFWKTKRTVEHLSGGGTLVAVLIVLLESAAVWTIWGLLFAVTSEFGSPLQIIMRDLSAVMVGIVNMIMYLRVELQCARPDGLDRTGVVMTSSASIRPYYVNRASAQIPRGTA
ncbi:hypothetical protein B0H16DRAFT_1698106 [Mycena metata]|uniref:Uncharacterized protein n=1 Tax=Mycena metata TaxID=1033252 RepID=A0AAD7HQZ0_9AGAR|nr:hypothetical protein B0H16DRAFT_1698106 [Mycena metata]